MRILFCHPNYPAQFRRLAPALAAQGHEVVFLARQSEWHAPQPQGLRLLRYETHRSAAAAEALHPYLRRFEAAVLEGQAVVRACQQLIEQGWQPDWIINHVGFGNGLYLSDAFPAARRIGLFEWYYNPEGADVDFLAQGPLELDRRLRLRTWNAQILVELAACDHAVVPTHWQARQFPQHLTGRLRVIHEGIDCDRLAALRSNGSMPWPQVLPPRGTCEVLTYVSRGFEDYRGFPQAMQTIAALQRRRPRLHALVVGADTVAYGATRSDGRSWGQWARDDLPLDPCRTHWLGAVQEESYHAVLAASDVHLYLTVPFVLSWSLLEAMAAGCTLVSSATPPVQEVLQHGVSAMLIDFFAVDAQVQAIEALLNNPGRRATLAQAARLAAQPYDWRQGLAAWRQLLGVDTPTTAKGSTSQLGFDRV